MVQKLPVKSTVGVSLFLVLRLRTPIPWRNGGRWSRPGTRVKNLTLFVCVMIRRVLMRVLIRVLKLKLLRFSHGSTSKFRLFRLKITQKFRPWVTFIRNGYSFLVPSIIRQFTLIRFSVIGNGLMTLKNGRTPFSRVVAFQLG